MLSRRRSSEQTAHHPTPPLQTSPSLTRLEAALRGVTVLFSIIAQPDNPTNPNHYSHQRPNLPRPPPDLSDAPPPPDHSAKRRLFARDSRPDRPRRSSAPAPPVHRLVVASSAKNPSQIRLYQLLDYPTVPRVSVTRSWNLSDLRKIDGLGLPVTESVRFGLFFNSGKMFVWLTHSPLARATFLWSLLQTCVSQLRRAPPVQHLRLLDLQTIAENPETSTDPAELDDDISSTNYAGSDRSNVRLASSLEELPDPHLDPLVASHTSPFDPAGSVAPTSRPRSDKPSASDFSRPVPHPGASPRISSNAAAPSTTQSSRPMPPPSPKVSSKHSKRPPRDSLTQKVTRTLSEPKVSAAAGSSSDSDNFADELRKPETIAQTRVASNENLHNLNIDERAFLAAAKRMGAEKPHHLKKSEVLEHFASVGSDPKARIFQNRLKAADGNTAKVIAERRIQQEKKMYRLNDEEKKDLAFALELFHAESNKVPLSDFGTWSDSQIQSLEVENIADIISVEEHDSTLDRSNRKPEYEQEHTVSNGIKHASHPYELLVDSVKRADVWLKKSETLLSPYASLAEDLNNEVILLALQRKNIVDMETQLGDLVRVIAFSPTEQELISDLDGMELSQDPAEANYTEIYQAVEVVSQKANALVQLPQLAEMESVAKIRALIVEKQEKASKALLPSLKKFLSAQYQNDDQESLTGKMDDLRLKTSEEGTSPVFSEFLKGARCLAMCGKTSFDSLLDHYVTVSTHRILETVRLLMRGEGDAVIEKVALDSRSRRFMESVFYACLAEGFRAFRLFGDTLEKYPGKSYVSISSILRRQVPGLNFVEEFITSFSWGDKTVEACLNLHFSHCLDDFTAKLSMCSDLELNGIVARIERLISPETAQLDASGSSLWGSAQYVHSERSSPWLTSSTVSFPQTTQSQTDQSVTKEDRVVSDCLSNFLVTYNELSLASHAMAEKHVNMVTTMMAAPRDISDPVGRAAFFARVKEAVDLCWELASPTFQGQPSGSTTSSKAKSLCEKLIAAAMRNTEVASAVGMKRNADIVKLQCYGYIAARLADAAEDFLIQLAHLSGRVRKHVMLKWAEENLFDSAFGDLHLHELKRNSSSAGLKIREGLNKISAADVSASMKKMVDSCMEGATRTCAIGPFYTEMIAMTREKFEEALRSARKDKHLAEVRPKLLAFSRELLSSLRADMKRQQQLAVQAQQATAL